MPKLKCIECGEIIGYENESNRPETCTNKNCDNQILTDWNETDQSSGKNYKGLDLVYLKTNDKISLIDFPSVIGVEYVGREILTQMKNSVGQNLISRRHCSLFLENNKFYICDLGSTNGTYIDNCLNLIKCEHGKKYEIKENEFIILGRERFLVKFIFQVNEINEIKNEKKSNTFENETILYQCYDCEYESNVKLKSCPNCRAINSFEKVDKKF